ncbi:MAG: hypothetical protein AABY22_27940, partial [Nanoarchaeota archaeon]
DDELRNLAHFFHVPTEKDVKVFETQKTFCIPANGEIVCTKDLADLRYELQILLDEIYKHNINASDEDKFLEIAVNSVGYASPVWDFTATKKVFIERDILVKEVYNRSTLVYNDFLKKKQQKEKFKQEKKNNTIVRDGI